MVAALPKLERERFANCMKLLSAFFTNVLYKTHFQSECLDEQ